MHALIPLLQKLLSWIVAKVLLALGLSFITYTGITYSLNTIKHYVSSHFNNIPSDILNILLIAGVGKAVGIIFGAYAFNAAMTAATKLHAGMTNKA